jgi:ATP/maltotriose-dependent transcriptional regulator MalT
VDQDYYDLFNQHDDDERTDLPVDQIKTEYENLLYRNDFSDAIDGMNLDLDLFEDHLRKKNKHYSLSKRKDRLIGENGLDLLRVFQLLREGYSNREIAHRYGVSDMFITTVKKEIKDSMVKFGIVWSYRAVRDGKFQEVY